MQNLNKSLLILLFSLFSLFAVSQSVTVVAGGNYTNTAYDQGSNSSFEFRYKFGFHAGAYYDYVIKKHRRQELVFETGLLFDSKGAKLEYELIDYTKKEVTNLYYIDLPFYLQYRYRYRSHNKIYGGIGPYAGYGLFGNILTTNSISGDSNTTQEKVKWGDNTGVNYDYSRLDYGVTARIGFHFYGGVDISTSYDYGIPDIYLKFVSQHKKNRVLRVSLGYTFSFYD